MEKRTCIIGGETHLGEITGCIGKGIRPVAVCVNDDIYNKYFKRFDIPNYENEDLLISNHTCDVAGIANENDKKYDTVVKCISAGMDVITDKPVCITPDNQRKLEDLALKTNKDILMLLTLRGNPPYMALKECMDKKLIGEPVFCHVRMAVRLKKNQRPSWFLNYKRSGGLFLDLLIHGIDALEWITGLKIKSLVSNMGNIGREKEENLRNHAAMFCELSNGATSIIEGQRMLPDTKSSDYRITIAGTKGVIDMDMVEGKVTYSNENEANVEVSLPEKLSVVKKWLEGESVISTEESLRANRIAVKATQAVGKKHKVFLD